MAPREANLLSNDCNVETFSPGLDEAQQIPYTQHNGTPLLLKLVKPKIEVSIS